MSELADELRKKYPEPSPEQKAQFNELATSMANRCRFGAVTTLFHQQPRTPAFTVDVRFTRFLDSDEQPYQRRLTLTESWVPLDLGSWIDPEKVAVLIIKNEEGRHLTIPTEEEKKDMAERRVFIGRPFGNDPKGFIDIHWQIRPDECFQGEPYNAQGLYLRAARGKVRCTLTVIPA